MKSSPWLIVGIMLALLPALSAPAKITVVVEHNGNGSATGGFRFRRIPAPSQNDAATKAEFTLLDGHRDSNGGDLARLHHGRLPADEDRPAENFFFAAGTAGGRLAVDLGSVLEIKQINTYSWHPGTRGPQVYTVYAGTGMAEGFEPRPRRGMDPQKCGWTQIAQVDTRSQDRAAGGQYAVGITDTGGAIGRYRYLLFDISRTEDTDPFGNTFYSEIDVVDAETPPVPVVPPAPVTGEVRREVVEAEDGYQIIIDTSETPDLTDWAHQDLAPVVREWYPRLVQLLPSEGYEAPKQVSITFSASMRGVAATGGARVRCAAGWFRQNLQGEAKGAVVHELGHVVQNYGLARRTNPQATRAPGWLVEGICDYIRWFLYEPQSHGAEITRRNLARARYDGNYRISANFLNWVTQAYSKDIVQRLNAAARAGRYSAELWQTATGHTLAELGDEWKAGLEEKIAAATAQANALSDEERRAGWKLLFDGQSLAGWHCFRMTGVRPGWRVQDGALICADPHNAGDLCTDDQYAWFELQIDYNISPGGNSGIMYHVTNKGRAAWASGPEFQLEDNDAAADPVRCGWLYALYQPPTDPATGRPLDATRPAGQWNHIRLVVSPEKCEHEVNGVKYFEYVLGSDDFQQRVAKSKFGKMPFFAKSGCGMIALQGDHGQVSFQNIKIRPLPPEKHLP